MVNEYQLSGLSNNNDGDDGCSVHAAYRRTYSPGQLAWSKGRRPPGAVATFIARTVRVLVIGFLCYSALEIVGVIIIIIIITLSNAVIVTSHNNSRWSALGKAFLWT